MRAIDSSNDEPAGRIVDDRKTIVYQGEDGIWHEGVVGFADVPDLSDVATLGCLLMLVRLAWKGKFTPTKGWHLCASSLVAALEAAP